MLVSHTQRCSGVIPGGAQRLVCGARDRKGIHYVQGLPAVLALPSTIRSLNCWNPRVDSLGPQNCSEAVLGMLHSWSGLSREPRQALCEERRKRSSRLGQPAGRPVTQKLHNLASFLTGEEVFICASAGTPMALWFSSFLSLLHQSEWRERS